jgi:putative ubiquitin-RnfH superfamily antitoxin RatB of RatAB toxin-antitoxin module
MRVQVAYVGPQGEALVTLDVAPDASVGEAVARSGIVARIDVPAADLAYAIFGRRVEAAA